jgi:hypothetical protein
VVCRPKFPHHEFSVGVLCRRESLCHSATCPDTLLGS